MSKLGYIQRYLLIIRRIKSHKYTTLAQLIEYIERQLEFHGIDNVGVSQRTIQRDIEDIRTDLGVSIEYCRTNRGYYIPADEESADSIERVFEPFEILNSLGADSGMQNFIIPEPRTATGTEHLFGLLYAIKNSLKVSFDYQTFSGDAPHSHTVQPYFIKESRGRWYLLAYQQEMLKTYGLDRMNLLQMTTERFVRKGSIDVREKYHNCFGIISNEEYSVEQVELSFDALDGKYLKSRPLHHSQRVIKDTAQEFQITLTLRITPDFVMELLSRSNSLRVIKPLSLRKHISETLLRTIERNR